MIKVGAIAKIVAEIKGGKHRSSRSTANFAPQTSAATREQPPLWRKRGDNTVVMRRFAIFAFTQRE